jgi:hypothetical protein
MSYRPSVGDVRAIRPFDMGDTDLEHYIDLASAVSSNSTIPNADKKTMWALLAAHYATVMREPEPTSTQIGQLSVRWPQGNAALAESVLDASMPGREYKQRLKALSQGWVLR